MKNRYCTIITLFCAVFFCHFNNTYGQENLVSELKCNATEYTVSFTSEKAMISRDGSEALPIMSGTRLTRPGTYFLTLIDNKKRIKINTFTILPPKRTTSWTITRESELEEILKYAIENFEKEITIKFNYGEFSINELSTLLAKRIDGLLTKYPKLVYEGHSVSSILGSKPTVQLKIEYPLKVTNTLKIYDAKTNKRLIQSINQNVVASMEDYEREIALFKYIINNITYSKAKGNGTESINATPLSHTMYGGMIDKIAVCDGYAKSLMYLLNAVGIPAKLIVGTSKEDGVLHAWNLVRIQGAYYHVDSTWGDMDGDRVGGLYEFFNETDSYMQDTHIWDQESYPKAITETYSIVYMPIDLTNVYRIMKPSDEKIIFSSLSKDKPKTATLVFYQDAVNKWNQDEMTRRIVNSLNKNIIYGIERKYNTLIISFKTE